MQSEIKAKTSVESSDGSHEGGRAANSHGFLGREAHYTYYYIDI